MTDHLASLASPQHAAAKRNAEWAVRWSALKSQEFALDMLRHAIDRLDSVHKANVRATLAGTSKTPLLETLDAWIKAQTEYANESFDLRNRRDALVNELLAENARLSGGARA